MKIPALKTGIPVRLTGLLEETPWRNCDNSGWPQHHKKCQEKPTAIQTWQMVQLVNSYFKQVTWPSLVPTLPRKENWIKDFQSQAKYFNISRPCVSVWQELHIFSYGREICLVDVEPTLYGCHQLSHWGWDGNNNHQLVRKTVWSGLGEATWKIGLATLGHLIVQSVGCQGTSDWQ